MNIRPLLRALLGIALVMSAAELGSAVIIWREAYVDAQPWFAVVFALLVAGAAALLSRGRTAGAVLCGLLCGSRSARHRPGSATASWTGRSSCRSSPCPWPGSPPG